jgi:protein O-GlcNAc transferase
MHKVPIHFAIKPCKGLPSLLLGSTSMKEYEERAVELALNPAKLQALTNKLKEVRMSCPLFDTARWVRNLERAYYKMWNLYCSGRHPEPFKVEEDDNEFLFDR